MDQKFVMMGNNILQNFIYENKFNEAAPFEILPTVRFQNLMEAYRLHHPDIIAFQECDEGWHDVLDGQGGLKSLGYAAAIEGHTDEPLRMIRNVVYYDTAKFTVIDAGYGMYAGTEHGFIANPWCYSWGVLEERESGERFAVASTHLVWGGLDNWPTRDRFARELAAKLHEIEEKYDVGVIAVGDYNAHLEEAAYKTLCGHFASARKEAAERINMEYETCNRIGQLPNASATAQGKIDHCFYTKDRICADKYEVMLTPEVLNYSDHVPHRFTFRVRQGNRSLQNRIL